MNKKIISKFLTFLAVTFIFTNYVYADTGEVVKTFSGCDYFIADGPRGYYVLEWYGGYDPDEGDTINGEIGSYGIKDVLYNGNRSGRVWVEDFLESSSGAMDEIRDHC